MMIKFLVPCLFLLLNCFSAFSQKTSDKAISESCDCIKRIDKSLDVNAQTKTALECFSVSIKKYSSDLQKEFGLTSGDDAAMKEVGMQLGATIPQKCPEMIPHLMNVAKLQEGTEADPGEAIDTDTLKLDKKVCALYKSGKYAPVATYANNREVPVNDATMFSEIKGGFVYEYEENKKYVTKWTVKWTGDCEWEQVLVETNSPTYGAMWKTGDKLSVKAIGSTKNNNLYITTKVMGIDMIRLLKKI